MARKRKSSGVRGSKETSKGVCCSRLDSAMSEHDAEVQAAVEKSVQRFLKANQENIRRSDKIQIASASYGGGMVDMMAVIRNVLGRWAVEQLLKELWRWDKAPPADSTPRVKVDLAGIDMAGVSKEDAKELEEKIAKWIEERKSAVKSRCSDPMFG